MKRGSCLRKDRYLGMKEYIRMKVFMGKDDIIKAMMRVNMEEVHQEMPGAVDMSGRASKVLLNWIKSARVDRALGRKGLF